MQTKEDLNRPADPGKGRLEVTLPGEGKPWELSAPEADFVIRGVRSVHPLERALVAYLPRETGRFILPLPAGGVALTAAASLYSPEARVEVFQLDTYELELGAQKTAALRNVEHVLATDVAASDEEDQGAAIAIHNSRDRLLMFDTLERLAQVMPDRSTLLVSVAKQRANDVLKKLDRVTSRGGVIGKCREGVVFRGQTAKAKAKWTTRLTEITASTPTEEVRLVTRPGVFSHGRPDAGGTALAETAQVEPGDRVLDIGCGCGIVGLLLAERMRRKGGEGAVVLLDSNVRAIDCARRSIELNGLERVRVELGHDFAGSEGELDVVVGNPPYYAGRRIAFHFLDIAKRALKPGGRLYIVSKHGREVAEYAAGLGLAVEGKRRRGYDVTVGLKR